MPAETRRVFAGAAGFHRLIVVQRLNSLLSKGFVANPFRGAGWHQTKKAAPGLGDET
jgi:hypothetical protein